MREVSRTIVVTTSWVVGAGVVVEGGATELDPVELDIAGSEETGVDSLELDMAEPEEVEVEVDSLGLEVEAVEEDWPGLELDVAGSEEAGVDSLELDMAEPGEVEVEVDSLGLEVGPTEAVEEDWPGYDVAGSGGVWVSWLEESLGLLAVDVVSLTGHVVTLMATVLVVKTVECAGQFVTVLWQLVM